LHEIAKERKAVVEVASEGHGEGGRKLKSTVTNGARGGRQSDHLEPNLLKVIVGHDT